MNIFRLIVITCALLFFSSESIANDSNFGTGTVAETMDSAGYTYVRLEEDDRWVAGRPAKIMVGDKVEYANAIEMRDFHSRTLDRTFAVISFAQNLQVIKPAEINPHADSAATTEVGEQLGITKSNVSAIPEPGEITPLDGGKTIDTVLTEYQQLTDQQVTIRAKVMKVSPNILGKNWITLQDGTGTAPDNMLRATSAELVEIGDLVTATGVVKTDVDLGSGYKYKVVLEETTFSK